MQTMKKFLLGIVESIQEAQRLRAEAMVRNYWWIK